MTNIKDKTVRPSSKRASKAVITLVKPEMAIEPLETKKPKPRSKKSAAVESLKTQDANPSKAKKSKKVLSLSPAMTPHITDYDYYLLGVGKHLKLYERLGAHLLEDGVHFALWAPNASGVSVVGDFNGWNDEAHPMQPSNSGIWSVFIPKLKAGALYKYALRDAQGHTLPWRADPFAFAAELPPATASIVVELPTATPTKLPPQTHDAPISIYEVHLGSWRRGEDNRYLTYSELADTLIPYVKDMGFTHLELMPISEHPFGGSWGYQPIGLFAPTSRFGTPQQFAGFIDAAHAAGLRVIIDWVPGHFPNDAHGLAQFDGTHLFEHQDPREGAHQDWGTLIYNFGRNEVSNLLIANGLFWLDRYGIDGLRVDAVASMIYRNYSRKEGEWVPNHEGGVENFEATALLKRLNTELYAQFPDAATFAEESTAWPGVSRPVDQGGLGFGFKWNMGWMHDTLDYMSKDPLYRRYHHHLMTFGMVYAYTENFVLPLSHDEVVYGKGSLLGKMPGDEWQRFANLRAYFGFMFGHPGKKLLFMGGEFAQSGEWQHDYSLDWHLLEYGYHQGVQRLVRDLNHLYQATGALFERDYDPSAFAWLKGDDADASVFAFARFGNAPDSLCVIASNFTPVPREGYRIGVPMHGAYTEALNSDAACYGGSNMGNGGMVHSEHTPHDAQPHSLVLTLSPLSTLILTYKAS